MDTKKTNNPKGRPKGSFNHQNAFLRNAISKILDDKVKKLSDDLDKMLPRDRVAALTQLMSFVLPKLQSIDLSVDDEAKSKYEKAIDNLAELEE